MEGREPQKGQRKCEEKSSRKERTSRGNCHEKNRQGQGEVKENGPKVAAGGKDADAEANARGRDELDVSHWVHVQTQPGRIIEKQNAPTTDRDIKAERQPESKQKWGRRPKQPPSQVITALPIKSFAARLGGESVAGMIHHCSVSQITDRPSPPCRSSESQINWPDTSNDSPW